MKRAKYGPEKIRDFRPVSRPQAHVNPKRRKIPEKTGVPKRDRDFAVFRYSRNTSTTAGGNTNLRIEAFVLGTLSCIFPFTS